MEIIRNGQPFQLTADELEKAYREKEHDYLLQDAENHLIDHVECTTESESEEFSTKYGFFLEEACDPSSEKFLLEDIVVEYEERTRDCNRPENDSWEAAVRSVLVRLEI